MGLQWIEFKDFHVAYRFLLRIHTLFVHAINYKMQLRSTAIFSNCATTPSLLREQRRKLFTDRFQLIKLINLGISESITLQNLLALWNYYLETSRAIGKVRKFKKCYIRRSNFQKAIADLFYN